MTISRRPLIAASLPLLVIILSSHVPPVKALTVREGHFSRVILCSDALPGTTSLPDPEPGKLACALRCTEVSSCTAYTFAQDGTCSLHTVDVTPHTCLSPATSSVHYKKTNTPSWYCLNGGMVSVDNTACQCVDGYVGDHCERLMEDCDEGIASGHYPGMSGVYWIHPPTSPTPFTVHCNYMVRHFIHMRYDADVDFNVTMAEYVTGFGDMMGDFWLGLEKLHLLTSSRHYTLGVQVSNFSEVYQHYYRRFVVKSAAEGYAMTFDTQYLPQAPALPMSDCLAPLKDIPFSAYDNDNDGNTTRNCAADYGGGWWYNADCSECNLMGTLRWSSLTRVPGAVDEVFWNPGLDPTFSPSNSWMFLFRTP